METACKVSLQHPRRSSRQAVASTRVESTILINMISTNFVVQIDSRETSLMCTNHVVQNVGYSMYLVRKHFTARLVQTVPFGWFSDVLYGKSVRSNIGVSQSSWSCLSRARLFSPPPSSNLIYYETF